MSHVGTGYDINQTFIIEPLDNNIPLFSACTALYTNNILSCSGDTQIFLGSGVITFDGNLYTNDNLSANTVNASTYYSGGTSLIDIVTLKNITGGTFNSTTDTLTLYKQDNSTVVVTGFTDYYTTGATIIGNTVYFDRNDALSAYTLNLSGFSADTYVTGVTFSNNQLIIGRNDGVNLNTFINTFTGLTVNGILNANTIYANTISATTVSASTFYGDGSNLTGLVTQDTYVTGGTYSSGTAIFTNNTGGTFSVTGFSTNTATSFTGGTVSGSTVFTNGLTANTVSATTYYNLPLDIHVTGFTFNNGNYNITINQNDGTSYTQSLSTLASDITITGGTYNPVTGVATFVNNTGGTFSVTGFLTGYTDTTISAFTYDNANTFKIDSTNGESFSATINSVTGLTVNGSLSATTYLGLPKDVFVTGGTYTNGNAIFTNNTGGTFNVSGFSIGGGGGRLFYLNISESKNGNRYLSTTATTAAEQSTGVTINNGSTGTIASFQSDVLGVTLIPGGVWSFYLHSYKEDSNASFDIFVEVYKLSSGGTSTLLFTTDPTNVTTNSPTPSMQLTDVYFSGSPIVVTDSIVSVVRATNTGNQPKIITLVSEGLQHYSYVVSTLPTQQGLTCDTLSGCSIIQTIESNLNNKLDKSGGTITNNLVINGSLSATTYLGLPIDVRVTGGTYNNGTATFTNNTGGTFTVTGLTIPFTGGTVSGNTVFTNGLTATTVSATTYLNTPYWESGSTGSYTIKAKNNSSIDATGDYSLAEGYATTASGVSSHAEGQQSTASGNYSHAEGYVTTASGEASHAEGASTTAIGIYSHAEGNTTTASGNESHSEGHYTIASGDYASHAEGYQTVASGDYGSHAEGSLTTAFGNSSHAEGEKMSFTSNHIANGIASHVEGGNTVAYSHYSHAEGTNNLAIGFGTHVEGYNNKAGSPIYAIISFAANIFTLAGDYSAEFTNGEVIGLIDSAGESLSYGLTREITWYTVTNVIYKVGPNETDIDFSPSLDAYTSNPQYVINLTKNESNIVSAHAEGSNTTASGAYSHAEGRSTIASGETSHAEGYVTLASGYASHAEGQQSTASGFASHAEGYLTIASGGYNHAEGYVTTASGDAAHAEGYATTASGDYSHSEGKLTTALGKQSHAEGLSTVAQGDSSHAEGDSTTAFAGNSHAGGYNSVANGVTSFVHGSNSQALGTNTVVFGDSVTGSADNTVYVPYFNIKYLSGGTSVNNLGIDANGYVVAGTTGGGSFTGGTVTGPTLFTGGLSANTFSATTISGGTLYGNGSNLTGISTPSGIFGIANSAGTYTFYSTLTAAMAAAVSGNVVEMFSDVTETSAVTITLKAGVAINGNGHTYILNNSGSTNAFQITSSGDFTIRNLSLIRTGSTITTSYQNLGVYVNANSVTCNFESSIFKAQKGCFSTQSLVNSFTLIGGAYYSGYYTVLVYGAPSSYAYVDNIYCESTATDGSYACYLVYSEGNRISARQLATSGGGAGLYGSSANIRNSYGYSYSSNGIGGSVCELRMCTGESNSGRGIYGAGVVSNCVGKSNTGIGLYNESATYNSVGISNSSTGFYPYITAPAYNCVGVSNSGSGMVGYNNNIHNCHSISASNIGYLSSGGLSTTRFIGCSFTSNWNNTGGHAVRIQTSNHEFHDCSFIVTNSSANCINGASAYTVKYSKSTFIGATTSVNANITQGITNTSDNQGNLTIN